MSEFLPENHGRWTAIGGMPMSVSTNPSALCPDLLRYEQIGEADGLRGRVVRTFFWLLRMWPPVAASRPRSAWLDG